MKESILNQRIKTNSKTMKRYEGLFILDLSGKEEGIKEVVDKLSSEITSVGARLRPSKSSTRRPSRGMPAAARAPVIS